MNKLRLTIEEKELFMRAIRDKLELDHHGSITDFTYDKKDVQEFLKELTETEKEIKKPTILIDSEVYTKMYELVNQSPIELQWHMMVTKTENIYTIYDILLFPQTNTGTSTTTDQDEFAEWITKLLMDPDFPFEHLRGHGHSHVNMNVYSSGIDDAYQRDLITKVEDGDFYLFFVLNKRMEMFALLYDFDQQIMFETKDMEIKIITKDGEDIREWCSEQIKTYCKTQVPKYRPTVSYAPSSLQIDTYKPQSKELISEITTKRKFGRKKK